MTPSDSPSSPAPIVGRWRTARRLLLAAATLATLLAVFYTVENWRGRRAWEKCRRELEARGEVLDWAAYIPPPVPDTQNIFKAPKMQEWFVKASIYRLNSNAAQPSHAPMPFVPAPPIDTNLVVAEVRVVTPDAPSESPPGDAVLRFNDPAAQEQAAKLLGEFLGPCTIGTRMCVLLARPLEQFKPLHWALQADTTPSAKELAAFFRDSPLTNVTTGHFDTSYLQVTPTAGNTFRLSLKGPVYGAADYLACTEPATADFELVRKALERPYARIEGDYQRPYLIPIPDFIRIRTAVQLLSQRAQCYLLLGQPEAAWRELALVHDLCRVLLAEPTGKPMTLVAAMIYTAVAGLHADIVHDGLRLHSWREPQLRALERQLQETDLLSRIVEAFREERAANCRTFETTSPAELVKLFNLGNAGRTWRDKLGDSVFRLALASMPRGWYYQNMVVGYEWESGWLGYLEVTNQLVRASQIAETLRKVSRAFEHRSPYTFLVAIGLPNYGKAVQTTARNQTLVNQARLACVLERYHLAHGQYPETLDVLTPQFIEKLPHDLIGGQPLKYRRVAGGGYLLYSIGWDEKDSGGVQGKSREEGDWVWQLR